MIDPYYSVQNEILKSSETASTLYQQWRKVIQTNSSDSSDVTNQLKQTLRGIEWNLDEIEDSVKAVELNPTCFSLSERELRNRRLFVNNVKSIIRGCKAQIANPTNYISSTDIIDFDVILRQTRDVDPLIDQSYSSKNIWNNSDNKSPQGYFEMQEAMKSEQDQHINQLSQSVSRLKTMSSAIGSELNDQSALLDNFSDEMELTQSKMTKATQKISRILHLESDKKQCYVLIGLSITLFIIFLLFIIL